MKKIFVSILSFIALVVSCDDMNDSYQKYLDAGERIYLGKTDSLTAIPDIGKVKLIWYFNADPKIEYTVIYWNSRQDSIVHPLNRTVSGIQKDSVTIVLEEGNYFFELVNKNSLGHRSLPVTVQGKSYGASFLSVTPSVTDIVFAADGKSATSGGSPINSLTFTVETNQTWWNVIAEPNWVIISRSGNQFTMSAAQNASTITLTSQVTISAGNTEDAIIEVIINVTQEAAPNETIVDVSQFSTNTSQFADCKDFVHSKIYFEDGKNIAIRGIDASKIADAYNRDFFDYNSATGILKFNGASGEYDVYYSPTYNYFLVGKMSAVYPDCYWMMGSGLSSCASQWHSDFGMNAWNGNNILVMVYMKPLGSGKYQATILVGDGPADDTGWSHFKINLLGNKSWDPFMEDFSSVTGGSFTNKLNSAKPWDVTSASDHGRWRVTLDVAAGTLKFEQEGNVSNETIVDVSQFSTNTSQFADCKDFVHSKIYFEDGKDIAIRGIDASKIADAYNRDFFDYNSATGILKFNGASGEYDVYYSPTYNYFLVGKMSAVYPDCYWMFGSGLSSCASQWHSDFGMNAWNGNNILVMVYMKPLGSGKYQATILVGDGPADDTGWSHFKINLLGNKSWDPFMEDFSSVTGGSFTNQLNPAKPWDVTSASDQGRWRVTLDVPAGTLKFESK